MHLLWQFSCSIQSNVCNWIRFDHAPGLYVCSNGDLNATVLGHCFSKTSKNEQRYVIYRWIIQWNKYLPNNHHQHDRRHCHNSFSNNNNNKIKCNNKPQCIVLHKYKKVFCFSFINAHVIAVVTSLLSVKACKQAKKN